MFERIKSELLTPFFAVANFGPHEQELITRIYFNTIVQMAVLKIMTSLHGEEKKSFLEHMARAKSNQEKEKLLAEKVQTNGTLKTELENYLLEEVADLFVETIGGYMKKATPQEKARFAEKIQSSRHTQNKGESSKENAV